MLRIDQISLDSFGGYQMKTELIIYVCPLDSIHEVVLPRMSGHIVTSRHAETPIDMPASLADDNHLIFAVGHV